MATIQQVAANYKTTANATVTLTGHTDTVGSPDVNMALSQRRAEAVRNALVREGVPAAAITTAAQGEAEPACPDRRQRGRAAQPQCRYRRRRSRSRWLAPA